MEKRYQVFVSSTYTDLKEERQKVIQTLMSMDCIPAGMELFPSIDEDQWTFIQKVIDDCDYYLIIVGGRYGSLTSEGLSYTEMEYDYAVKKGIKVIVFLRKNLDSIPVNKTDNDIEKKEKLDNFINKLKDGRLVQFWDDEKELPGLVALSLLNTIKKFPAVGWIRGNNVSNESLYVELEKLRKENQELKNSLSKTINNSIEIDTDIKNNLANLNDEYVFEGSLQLNYQMDYSPWCAKDTWKNVFSAISPYLIEAPNDVEVRKALNQYFTKKETTPDASVTISMSSLHTIKIQFMALGLIDNMGVCWKLTEIGKQEMIKYRVIKKTNNING